ncbi:MAG: DUF1566 domain-containing protein [Betaproteobacteria bacterium]|nr:DUF1566 domain-containing protein [Betaproteobacteria bacterium]
MERIKYLMMLAGLGFLGACGGGGGGGGMTIPATAVVTSKASGMVADKQGVPIAGVTISVFHHNNNTTVTTTTDANGVYAVAGLDTGNYTDGASSDYEIYAEKAGFGFYPSVGDAAGTITKFDFNGLYRTVARFNPVPSRDVPNTSFTAYRPGDKVANLPRTGQTTSYASGDDFSVQKGVAWPGQRFTDNANGSVTDQLTGLVWLKNAGCYNPADWATALASANQLASGACGLTDGSTAGQWRMPNANELESLVDVSRANPAISSGHPFTNVNVTEAYWTSTTYMALKANAMAIRFSDGRWINGSASASSTPLLDAGVAGFDNNKTTSANVLWAVKSGAGGVIQTLATGVYSGQGGGSFGARDDASLQLGAPATYPRFIDKGDGTVADTMTGLTWLKQADCIKQTWSSAIATVNGLASGQCGLTDGSSAGQWRMPNRNEMLSLSDRAPTFPQASYLNGQYQASTAVTGPVIFKNFIVFDYYWTSTTDAADTTQAWAVYSCDFGVYNNLKTSTRYALAVR